MSLYFILTRRGKICIFKFGECKPCFAQRVKFCRNSVIEEGLYPVMGFNLRGVFYNYFGDWEPFTLQRISARQIIDSFVNQNGEMVVQDRIPRPVENLLKGEWMFYKRSTATIRWSCDGNGVGNDEQNVEQ